MSGELETLFVNANSVKESNRSTMVSRVEYMKVVDEVNKLKKEKEELRKLNNSYRSMLVRVTQTKITGTSLASIAIRNLIKQINILLEKK